MRISKLSTFAKIILLSTVLVGCGNFFGSKSGSTSLGDPSERTLPGTPYFQPSPLSLVNSMQTFDDCNEAETYFEDRIVARQNKSIDRSIESPLPK